MEGNFCLSQKGCLVHWVEMWVSKGAQGLASVESCCPPNSVARSPGCEGDVSKGG